MENIDHHDDIYIIATAYRQLHIDNHNQPSHKLNANSSTHFDCESVTSSLETITTRYYKMENIYQEIEIEQIAQGL